MPPGENRLQQDPAIDFTKVPAELRAQLIETLKTRPEFKQVWEAAVQGAGVNLSLRMPEPMELACEGLRFTAFGWRGQIYVIGEEVPLSDCRGSLPGTR